MSDVASLDDWNEVGAKAIDVATFDALVVRYKEQREIYEATKKAATVEYLKVQEMENQILALLKDSKKSKYFVDGIGTVYKIDKYVVRTPKELQQLRDLYDYVAKNHGQDAADQMFTVNHQTLNSFYNKEAEASEDPAFKLPGVESPTLEQSLGLRKK